MLRRLSWVSTAWLLMASAALADDDLGAALRWRSIGPYRGGRVVAVAGVPGQPLVYYQGATGGGVWKSEDAGNTWRNVSDGLFKTGSVGAIAVAPSNPDVVYVGMGEACIRSNFSHGDGVYRSDDAGKTWRHLGLADTRQIGRIQVDPRDPNRAFVAAVGHATGPNPERGVFRTTDGGASWQRVLFVDDKTGASDIEIDPHDPSVVYAGLWPVRRTPWGIFSGGPGGGLYRSSDGGTTWHKLVKGLPQGEIGRVGVAVSRARPQRVWALVEAKDGGLYRSDDGGASFALVNQEFEVRRRPYYYTHVFADTKNPETVYVLTDPLLKSTDGGRSFQPIRVPHGDNHALWIAPEDSRRLINGNDGGANVSLDGGQSWSRQDNQPTAQFYWVATDDRFPYRVYGAQQDNTTVSIASRSSGAGISPADWHAVGGGESGFVAPHPAQPHIVFAGSYWGLLTRYDERTGEARNVSVWPDLPLGRVGEQLRYRFPWTFPIVFSPHDPATLYASANVLFRTRDEGQSWQAISPDLTRDDKSRQRDDRLTDFYGTIASVAPSRLARGLIWVGSDDGLVHLTRDDGATWQKVTPPTLPEWSRLNVLEASPHDAGAAYLAANRYLLDDMTPHIFRTRDYGASWTRVVDGLPADAAVRVVREDPVRRGLLYAGTETGVFVSGDDGEHWRPLQLKLPVVPVTDLAVKGDDLVASTQGRGFWILDDLTPLRHPATGGTQLLPPRPAYRLAGARGFGRAPVLGENPPNGAVIHYRLAGEGAAAIEIQDAAGRRVARFEGQALPQRAGLNQLVWDTRYPDAHRLAGRETHLFGANLRGPVAAPGPYTVRLFAGGDERSEALEIRGDPRASASPEALRQQFELLIAIRDRLSSVHDAASRILAAQDRLRAARAELLTRPRGGPLAQQAERVSASLRTVLDELVELRFLGMDDQMLEFHLRLNARMAALQRVVASAEAGPTTQARAVFDEVSGLIDVQLGRLDQVFARELAPLEQRLRDMGLATPAGH